MVVATLFVVWVLRPSLLTANTLPAGGDLSLHDWGPAYLRQHVLPHLSGWSWDWFDGFPAYQFYPVLPPIVVVGLSFVLAYGVAMKLVIVAGLVLLPLASYLFARWWQLPFPAPPLAAVAALVFLFDTSDTGGGTIFSTIGGEYSYTLGLALAVLTIGLFSFVVRQGRWRAATAVSFAAAALAHPLTGVFVLSAAVCIVVVHLGPQWRPLLVRVAPVVVIGGALAGVWWIPFVAEHAWMTDPDFIRDVGLHYLFPFGWAEPFLIALMAAGLVLGWRAGHRIVGALALMSILYAVLFFLLPQGQFQNGRALPFWSWSRLSLAAVGLAELLLLVAARLPARVPSRWRGRLVVATTALALVVVMAVAAAAWLLPPFGHQDQAPSDHDIEVAFAGYQRNPQYPQYHALMDTMDRIGKEYGCGRFAWSVDVATTDYGTVDNALVPYWTNDCITSLRGLFFDSSATTPFVNLTESLTSIDPEYFTPGLPYQPFNIQKGVQNLQYAGVRYYAARTAPVVAAAASDGSLVPIAVSGPWHIYRVTDSAVVAPLPSQPVVFAISSSSWAKGSADYVTYAQRWNDVVMTRTGPGDWDRITSTELPAKRALPPVKVSHVTLTNGGLSFHVDRTGVPVLVKASYFPGWSMSGGQGPYQAAGNMMVVIPTSTTVTMTQSSGALGAVADASGVAGLIGLVALFVIDRRRSQNDTRLNDRPPQSSLPGG